MLRVGRCFVLSAVTLSFTQFPFDAMSKSGIPGRRAFYQQKVMSVSGAERSSSSESIFCNIFDQRVTGVRVIRQKKGEAGTRKPKPPPEHPHR
jgi:hypothetical protein